MRKSIICNTWGGVESQSIAWNFVYRWFSMRENLREGKQTEKTFKNGKNISSKRHCRNFRIYVLANFYSPNMWCSYSFKIHQLMVWSKWSYLYKSEQEPCLTVNFKCCPNNWTENDFAIPFKEECILCSYHHTYQLQKYVSCLWHCKPQKYQELSRFSLCG